MITLAEEETCLCCGNVARPVWDGQLKEWQSPCCRLEIATWDELNAALDKWENI
jgi:hypothetical protein